MRAFQPALARIFGHLDSNHGQIHVQLLAAGVEELRRELGESGPAPVRHFFSVGSSAKPRGFDTGNSRPARRRINGLLSQGGNVLLFRERELYAMTALVNRYTKAPVRSSQVFRS